MKNNDNDIDANSEDTESAQGTPDSTQDAPDSTQGTPDSTSRLTAATKARYARTLESLATRMAAIDAHALTLLERGMARNQTPVDWLRDHVAASKALESSIRGITSALTAAAGLRDDLPTTRARVDATSTVTQRVLIEIPTRDTSALLADAEIIDMRRIGGAITDHEH